MSEPPRLKALVLQGGGALGAYELGVARVLYGERGYAPDIVAGVSIGAITAVLLARPKRTPLEALEGFWARVTVAAPWWPEAWRPYASMWGNPNFFTPRLDLWGMADWTSIYSTEPLKRTLAEFVDEEALADPKAKPGLIMTATDVEAGEIKPFWSEDGGLTLDHVLASGSLPPSFPATMIGERSYWDGGLFDNTPLGAVIEKMKPPSGSGDGEHEIIVVNLFPNAGPLPRNLSEVNQRMLGLTFANKTESDLKLLKHFNALALLMAEIRANPAWEDLQATPAFKTLDKDYLVVPRIVEITREGEIQGPGWTDFSPQGIARLADAGARATAKALGQARTDALAAE